MAKIETTPIIIGVDKMIGINLNLDSRPVRLLLKTYKNKLSFKRD